MCEKERFYIFLLYFCFVFNTILLLILKVKRLQAKSDSRAATHTPFESQRLYPKSNYSNADVPQPYGKHISLPMRTQSFEDSESSQVDAADYEARLAAVEKMLARAKLGTQPHS